MGSALAEGKTFSDDAGEIGLLLSAGDFLAVCADDPIGFVGWVLCRSDVAAPVRFRRHHIDADALTVRETILATEIAEAVGSGLRVRPISVLLSEHHGEHAIGGRGIFWCFCRPCARCLSRNAISP